MLPTSRHAGYTPVAADEVTPNGTPRAAAAAVADHAGKEKERESGLSKQIKALGACLLWLTCSSTIIIINKVIMVRLEWQARCLFGRGNGGGMLTQGTVT